MLNRNGIRRLVAAKVGEDENSASFLIRFDAALHSACQELPAYGDFRFLQRVARIDVAAGVHEVEFPYQYHHMGELWSRDGRIELREGVKRVGSIQRVSKQAYADSGQDAGVDARGEPAQMVLLEPLHEPLTTEGTIATVGIDFVLSEPVLTLGMVGLPIAIDGSVIPRFIASYTNATTGTISTAMEPDAVDVTFAISPPPRERFGLYPAPSRAFTVVIPYEGKLLPPTTGGSYMSVPEDVQWLMVLWTIYTFHQFEQDDAAAVTVWHSITRIMGNVIRKYSDSQDRMEMPEGVSFSRRRVRQ